MAALILPGAVLTHLKVAVRAAAAPAQLDVRDPSFDLGYVVHGASPAPPPAVKPKSIKPVMPMTVLPDILGRIWMLGAVYVLLGAVAVLRPLHCSRHEMVSEI